MKADRKQGNHMEMRVEETKKYEVYKTLSALPDEIKSEYESFMKPEPVDGVDVHVVLTISSAEVASGVDKELDVTISGETKRIIVQIPVGITNGKYLRYRERGEAGKHGGKHGDLYVKVVVEQPKEEEKQPEPVKGRDINCTLKITNEEWVKGVDKEKEVKIDGVTKHILVRVPPAFQNGGMIRYKGKGEAGKFGGENGDLYVHVVTEPKVNDQKEEAEKNETLKGETQNNETQKTETQTEEPQKNVPVQLTPTDENTIPITISFLEAAKGTEKEVALPEKAPCKKCNGSGQIIGTQKTVFGSVKKTQPCSVCKGSGKLNLPQKVSVKIPAGIDEGQYLRLKGKNDGGNLFGDVFQQFFGNKNSISDWYVKIHIDKHPKFERKGYDIYSTEYLPFLMGAGRKVSVDTLDGKQYVNLTKEVKDGTWTKLDGKGIPNLKDPSIRGHHYVMWKKK